MKGDNTAFPHGLVCNEKSMKPIRPLVILNPHHLMSLYLWPDRAGLSNKVGCRWIKKICLGKTAGLGSNPSFDNFFQQIFYIFRCNKCQNKYLEPILFLLIHIPTLPQQPRSRCPDKFIQSPPTFGKTTPKQNQISTTGNKVTDYNKIMAQNLGTAV